MESVVQIWTGGRQLGNLKFIKFGPRVNIKNMADKNKEETF